MGKKLTKKAENELALNQFPPNVTVGTQVIGRDGHVYQITKITKKGEIHLGEKEDDKISHYGNFESFEELTANYTILDKPIAEYEEELMKELQSGFASYKADEAAKASTDMVLSSGKDVAEQAQRHMVAVTQKLAVLTGLMEQKKNELQSIKQGFQDQLKKINRVVGIIELYLGVHSTIEHIKEGGPAPIDYPICFRQLVLHMDEEVALEQEINGGLDFSNVEVFDKWVSTNVNKILPELKGIVVCRPRRHSKDYGGDNPFLNEAKNAENMVTYFLIRNGGNLYRIRTNDLYIYPHLFPSQAEMEKMSSGEGYHDRERNEDKMLGYKRNVLFLQGLIDRTEVFRPHAEGLNLLRPQTYGESVKFIYDADGLGDGRMSYTQWLTELNSQLQRGDRIYFMGGIYASSKDDEDRFPQRTQANSPSKGVYNIKRIEDFSHHYSSKSVDALIIQYNPKDVIYNRKYWQEEKTRSKSIPVRLFRNDTCIINYEKIKIADIDYYLQDRVNRKHYLKMMPVLKGIKKSLIEEKKWEDGFFELIMHRQNHATEDQVREAIEWWKRKVIEKRPLTKEDAKAVRMIMKYLANGDTNEEVE